MSTSAHRVLSKTLKCLRGEPSIAAAFILFVAVFALYASLSAFRVANVSPEMGFTDATERGMHIVPASGGSAPPATCNQTTSYQEAGCPAGYTGSQTQMRITDCNGAVLLDWTNTAGNSCQAVGQPPVPPIPPTPPTCTPSFYCGWSVAADCSTTGGFDPSIPGCGTGTGTGTATGGTGTGTATGGDPGPSPGPTCDVPGYNYILQGSSCVFVSCASGWQQVGASCVINQCPSGQAWNGSSCVQACQPNFFYCGVGSDAGTLYERIFNSAPACIANDVIFARCDGGCDSSRGVCNQTSSSNGRITASPSLVRSGDRTTVSWQVSAVTSCVVTGTNGDVWSCSGSACGSVIKPSNPIAAQTTYMLTCAVPGSANIVKTATVNIIPVFNEH